ncbi:uncharacterized protein [Periplaneta americana]|uniref:uncharacterized protein isoform X3 n=1 Tax=Periplaneta americana TaxID=6978 RepID=UPI0037E825FD
MESEVDPLAIQTSDYTDVEDKKPLSEVKKECVDQRYYLASELTLDDNQLPINFAFVKYEAEEEPCNLGTEEWGLKLAVTAEQNELSTERKSMETAATWGLALSCINTNPAPIRSITGRTLHKRLHLASQE